jgi:23S rRNA (uridine2552-2'-O)-methyltransferase
LSSSRYTRKDHFHQRAKSERWVARSVYKLEELNRRFSLIRKNDRVVDFGCAPGSWLQYLGDVVGRKGAVVGYDVEPVEVGLPPQVRFHRADIAGLTTERIRADLASVWSSVRRKPAPDPVPKSFGPHAVLSDMAPKLTGVRDADQARSVELAEHALRLAEALMPSPQGPAHFVAKIFQGRETDAFVSRVKQGFHKVRLIKPEATREGSREVFVVAEGRRQQASGPPIPTGPKASGPGSDDGASSGPHGAGAARASDDLGRPQTDRVSGRTRRRSC